ncbi:MAG: LamG domain-containing protein, partial [Acidobacteriota bacterium]
MKRMQDCLVVFFACVVLSLGLRTVGAQQETRERWSFEAASEESLRASLAQSGDTLDGKWRLVPGVRGNAVEFDGYTTGLTREAKKVPALGNAFTVSAWVALDSYPWNWLPLADQSQFQQVGFSLAVDAFGHVGLSASVDGVWKQVVTESTLPLKKWVHVTGVFNGDSGLTILVDGKVAGHLEAKGTFWQAVKMPLIVGRVREPEVSFPAWISHPQDASWFSLEGDLGEVELVGRAVSAEEDREAVAAAHA